MRKVWIITIMADAIYLWICMLSNGHHWIEYVAVAFILALIAAVGIYVSDD